MNKGQKIFAQVMKFIPHKVFARCVATYNGERYVKSFTCMDQYLCMAFAQLTCRECLRDIECCLRAHHKKLWHMRMRSLPARNTLANANERRDWRIRADFSQVLIQEARELYAGDSFGAELEQTACAFDSTTISLYTILQILSASLFEKKPILSALQPDPYMEEDLVLCNQLNFF